MSDAMDVDQPAAVPAVSNTGSLRSTNGTKIIKSTAVNPSVASTTTTTTTTTSAITPSAATPSPSAAVVRSASLLRSPSIFVPAVQD